MLEKKLTELRTYISKSQEAEQTYKLTGVVSLPWKAK